MPETTEAVRTVDPAFREDVLRGLREPQPAIPARWLYDRRGSELFDDITRLDEYYPTRSESEILKANGAAFAQAIGTGRAVVEFGSGSSAKTPLLLSAIDPAAIAAIGLTGQMHGLTTLDKDGKPLRPAILWNDQRSGKQCEEITA